MARRPNILFCFADDWGRYASAYAGVPGASPLCTLIHTPHIDRVAREGALFANALVPAPTCTPCRSSLLSGRYFWQTRLGAILQGAVWDRRIASYPFLLESAGYHIGFSDKVWAPGTPHNDPYGGEARRYQRAGHEFGQFSQFVTNHAERLGGIDAAKRTLLTEVSGNFSDFLAARDGATPFCYWWGPVNTHRAWQRGSGKALWGIDPDALRGQLPPFLPDVHEVREDVADYLGECQAFDSGVGALLADLEARGELDNTLVVVSGDHGIPGFPRAKCNLYDIGCEVALVTRWPERITPGVVIDDLVNLMDLAPTFLDAAGVSQPADMPARSLLPLLTAGHSGQIDPQRTWVITGRERHVAQARADHLPYPQRALRTHTHLYIRNFAPERWPMGDPCGLDDPHAPAPDFDTLLRDTFVAYADLDCGPTKAWMVHHRADPDVRDVFALGFGKRPAEELYDLRTDPHQMRNLADDPAHAAIRTTLAAQLVAELARQDDPRVGTAPCRFEASPYTDWPCPESAAVERVSRA